MLTTDDLSSVVGEVIKIGEECFRVFAIAASAVMADYQSVGSYEVVDGCEACEEEATCCDCGNGTHLYSADSVLEVDYHSTLCILPTYVQKVQFHGDLPMNSDACVWYPEESHTQYLCESLGTGSCNCEPGTGNSQNIESPFGTGHYYKYNCTAERWERRPLGSETWESISFGGSPENYLTNTSSPTSLEMHYKDDMAESYIKLTVKNNDGCE